MRISRRQVGRAMAGAGIAALLLGGCGSTESDEPTEMATAVEGEVTISFWHVYQGGDQEALDALIDSFEEEYPEITVDAQYSGSFGEINQKIIGALQADSPPNVAIAYPAQVIDYHTSGQVLNLTPFIESNEVGLSTEELDDIFEVERTINRYQVAQGDYLSFPFTANAMVMYYNQDLLDRVGIDQPPATWAEFADQCAIIKAELGLSCFASTGNSSTIDAIAGGFGGTPYDAEGNPTVDSPEWTQALEQLQSLAESGYVQVAGGGESVTSPDLQLFISQQAAFVLGSSRNIGFLPDAVGDTFTWQAAPPPQPAATENPVTVLYGPGLAAFDHDSQTNLASWLFLRHIASAPAQEQWALDTGQLPVRDSVATSEEFQAELAGDPSTAVAYGLVPDTVWDGALGPDGVIQGISQQERELLASVMNAVLLGDMDAATAQQQLVAGFSG